jgi:RNA polymerase sigma-70 factor (ECF subfamily)
MTRHAHGHGRSCRDLVATISDYVAGDLTPARCRELEAHLADCPCCDRFAGSLRKAIEVCRASGDVRLPAAVQQRARARIRALLGDLPACAPRRAGNRRSTSRP